jgi:Fe-S-cluster formation regulator IscX/YfhJ
MKIRSAGAQLYHADGRTDRLTDLTKLIVTYSKFSHAPKRCQSNGNNFLNREAKNPPKTVVRMYQSTLCQVPEASNLHLENHNIILFLIPFTLVKPGVIP